MVLIAAALLDFGRGVDEKNWMLLPQFDGLVLPASVPSDLLQSAWIGAMMAIGMTESGHFQDPTFILLSQIQKSIAAATDKLHEENLRLQAEIKMHRATAVDAEATVEEVDQELSEEQKVALKAKQACEKATEAIKAAAVAAQGTEASLDKKVDETFKMKVEFRCGKWACYEHHHVS